MSEDVWLSFLPWGMGEGEDEEMDSGQYSGPSTLGTCCYQWVVMFLANMVRNIAYCDVTVDDDHLNILDNIDFLFATNILWVLNLFLFILNGLWIHVCGPAGYK